MRLDIARREQQLQHVRVSVSVLCS